MSADLWQAILSEIELTMSRGNFITWVKPTQLLGIKNNVATVRVPTIFYKERFETHFRPDVLAAIRKHVPVIKDVRFTLDSGDVLSRTKDEQTGPENGKGLATESDNQRTTRPEVSPASPGAEEAVLSHPNLDYQHYRPQTDNSPTILRSFTFDSFVEGVNSRLAFNAGLVTAKEPGKRYNPLFIYGGVGLGKTHLMHAIANEITEHNTNKSALYVSCETFTNEYIDSIRNRKMDVFKKRYRSVDVLLVDDVQFIANKEGSQEEFFNTFNALHQTSRQIVLTADRPPAAIIGLEDRLSSRFGMGIVVDIQPANLETRMAIVERKASEKGVLVPLDVVEYIAIQAQNNIRQLEGALNLVLGRSEIMQVPISLDSAKITLSSMYQGGNQKTTGPDAVLGVVAEHFGISLTELTGKNRQPTYVYPRHIAMYVLRDQLGMSYPDIGKVIGGKDHTSVMYAVNKITSGRSQPHIGRDLDAVRRHLS